MTEPAVSVILIGYNDSTRIMRALDSLRRQTLRSLEIIVVDDASTDATVELVDGVAKIDDRIRVIRRTENSGGCSAPRNDGLAVARAPWVMFCDSDDEYEPHACANLLFAAQDWDADVVCGMAVRRDVRKDRDKPWRPELHAEDRIVESLEAEPELLYDTISVNKIYRRSMLVEQGIDFPPGLLFEDQVFTLRCYLSARRIGILQATVYIWNVDRAAEELSITQGRMQPRNVVDRIRINQMMDDLLSTSSEEVRLAKAIKFLRHEGYLYLWAIAENPDADAARTTATTFRDYVMTVDTRAFDHVRPALRVALFGLLTEDLDLLRCAMRWERWASVVDTRIRQVDGRQLWSAPTGRVVLDRDDAQWLDVSRLHLLDMPFSTRRYFHELVAIDVTRSSVGVTIHTTDYAGDLDASVTAELAWIDKAGAVIAALPLDRHDAADGRVVRWRGDGPPTVFLDRALMRSDKGSIAVRLTRDSVVNTTVVRTVGVAVDSIFVPFPAIAFADRPAGATLFVGERASIAWRPGGLSRGPLAWGRRLSRAARRRTGGDRSTSTRDRVNPGSLDVPLDRPVVAYLPAPWATGSRAWPLDLSLWESQMADACYLLAGGRIAEPVPTRLWGAVRDARHESLVDILDHCAVLITDDPTLLDTKARTIVFRPDEGAARYLLPPLPSGYAVIETADELMRAVRSALGDAT